MNRSGIVRWSLRALAGIALATGLMVHAENRRVDKKVAPAYPELARRMHITGVVHVSVTIAPDGSVTEVKTLNGNQLLSGAAEDAVKKWKFEQADAATKETVDITFADGN
jgi:TonB family protein